MIAIASDFAGYPLKESIKKYLENNELEYEDFGTHSTDVAHYPPFAYRACKAVVDGQCDKAILICGSGIGMSIVANKVDGIRCVCCTEPYSAKMSRLHNNANAIALGARIVASGMADLIIETWLAYEYEGGVHDQRLDMIKTLEQEGKIASH